MCISDVKIVKNTLLNPFLPHFMPINYLPHLTNTHDYIQAIHNPRPKIY